MWSVWSSWPHYIHPAQGGQAAGAFSAGKRVENSEPTGWTGFGSPTGWAAALTTVLARWFARGSIGLAAARNRIDALSIARLKPGGTEIFPLNSLVDFLAVNRNPVSYTHLTLPTIYSV